MGAVNATTLAAAGSLLAIAELIELIKDPEYAKRIPELVDAQETILKAEDFRKEQAAFDARVAELDSSILAADLRAVEALQAEAAVTERENQVAAKEADMAQAQAALVIREDALAIAETRLKDTVASYVTKGNQLDAEFTKARVATSEANALRDEYKAKLTTLSNL